MSERPRPTSRGERAPAELTAADADALARFAGLEIPPEDRAPLREALAEQQASIAAFDAIATGVGLAGDDLARAMPALSWDPRWR